MKLLTLIFLLTLSCDLSAQNKIAGNYRNYFSSHLQLNADSTFKYTYHFDLYASWTTGNWMMKDDTVYFQIIPIYDTTENNQLLLSLDEIPERLTRVQYEMQGLSSGGQNRVAYPEKLVYKNKRLYTIKNGQLIKERQKKEWTNRKFPLWFFRSND